METTSTPQIVAAERMGGGIFIEFDDGKSALYPALLLYGSLHQAIQVDTSNQEDFEANASGTTAGL
ncbi:MAG: hypothetical protein WAM85_02840 [Terracidiphilus sp.]